MALGGQKTFVEKSLNFKNSLYFFNYLVLQLREIEVQQKINYKYSIFLIVVVIKISNI